MCLAPFHKHRMRYFTDFSQESHKAESILIPILKMMKLRLREVKQLAQVIQPVGGKPKKSDSSAPAPKLATLS